MLYDEEIKVCSLLETVIDNHNLINKDNFDSQSDYEEAIEKFAYEIEILKLIKEKFKYAFIMY